ncbi:MAG: hypothetical protein ACNA7Z_01285 [Dethiobacteria bacterium]
MNRKMALLVIISFTIMVMVAGIFYYSYLLMERQTWHLVVEDPRDNVEYYFIKIKPGDHFTLTCRNSVSKSLVTGTFAITTKGQFEPLTTAFTSYGPGLPLDFLEEYEIEGNVITVMHSEEPRDSIRLWVTPSTEETFYLNNMAYPLGELTDTYLLVYIYVSK